MSVVGRGSRVEGERIFGFRVQGCGGGGSRWLLFGTDALSLTPGAYFVRGVRRVGTVADCWDGFSNYFWPRGEGMSGSGE